MTERTWQARLRETAAQWRKQFWASEAAVMTVFALLCGAATGLAAVTLIFCIRLLSAALAAGAPPIPGPVYVVLLPAAGGLLAGVILRLSAVQQKGLDVADVIAAIAANRGRIAPLQAIAKALAAAIAISAGGSAGREGPIAHVGCALGSAMAQAARLNERRLLALLAAGGAGGLAATFNAPLAGIMFGVEVILGAVGVHAFGALVVSAVTATVISRAFLGSVPAFAVPVHSLTGMQELPLYVGLGALAALAALLFAHALSKVEDLLGRWTFPVWIKPAAGGVIVGLIGVAFPRALGMGFAPIEEALRGDLGMGVLLGLAGAKMLAASLTIGSGAAGGVFAPLLFVGAMIGGAYGQAAHRLAPSLVAAGGGDYAIVGMAAVLAAAVRAPVTALLLVFEMGQDYHIMPALFVAVLVATVLTHGLLPASIYGLQLRRRGIEVVAQPDANLLRTILVEDAMTPAGTLESVSPATGADELAQLFQETGHHGFVVLDDAGELFGIVTLADLERAIETGKTQATVSDICTRDVVTVYPDETLDDALRRFASLDVGRLPVVEHGNPRHVIGTLRRSGIVRAYARALARTPDDEDEAGRARLQAAVGAELAEFVLEAQDRATGHRVRDVGLPEDCVVISIHRRGRVVIPRGNVQLQAGDRVIILKVATSVDALRCILRTGARPADPG